MFASHKQFDRSLSPQSVGTGAAGDGGRSLSRREPGSKSQFFKLRKGISSERRLDEVLLGTRKQSHVTTECEEQLSHGAPSARTRSNYGGESLKAYQVVPTY